MSKKVVDWLENNLWIKIATAVSTLIFSTWAVVNYLYSEKYELLEKNYSIEIKSANQRYRHLAEEKEQLDQLRRDYSDSQSSRIKLEAEIATYRARDESVRKTLEDSRAELKRIRVETEELEGRLESKSLSAHELTLQLVELQSANQRLENEIDTLTISAGRSQKGSDGFRKELHSFEGTITRGGAFVDELTGAILGVDSLSPISNTIDGVLTFPDGTQKRLLSERVGSGWQYQWNGRRFVISVAGITAPDKIKVSVRETTETRSAE